MCVVKDDFLTFSILFTIFRRSSDDPLISGGTITTNNHKNELKPIPESPSPPIHSTPPILADPGVSGTARSRKPNRARKVKGQVKLRFHHQALPQKYLEHYESTQNKINSKVFSPVVVQRPENVKVSKQKHVEVKEEQSSLNCHADVELQSKNVRNWLEKLNNLNHEDVELPLTEIKHETELQIPSDVIATPITGKKSQNIASNTTPATSSRCYNYNDLPYMGEMTLANSKPRRGRKPKKADICHLIYKNYGQIFPGTPTGLANGVPGSPPDQQKIISTEDHQLTHKKTNKILSSLLEKRLTQSKVDAGEKLTSGEKIIVPKKPNQNEPLNLCLRDASPSSSATSSIISSTISVHDDDDDDDDSIMEIDGGRPLDIATDPLLAGEKTKPKKFVFPPTVGDADGKKIGIEAIGPPPPPEEGYIYWPAGKCYIHPMALYYQKMIDNGMVPPTTNIVQKSDKGMVPTSSKQAKLVAKNISELLAKTEKPPTPSTTPSSVKSVESNSGSSTTSSSMNSLKSVILTSPSSSSATSSVLNHHHQPGGSNQAHPKRKRSAIFIPPMPSENTSNPTTELSICKFKFTGGAKPSLQEKKMLSVDSGGNFRYYSGTGDKSMRGYEFFPRESLQQSGLSSGGSSSGAFLNTPGEKIITEDPLTSLELSSDVLQIPNFSPPVIPLNENTHYHPLALVNCPTPSTSSAPSVSNVTPMSVVRPSTSHAHTTPAATSRSSKSSSAASKRKSRRSIQREKLEKTFKEKGFLIQTEQLESAEGATYCKFRQLRRFTRYLFRSWKDYLPGDIQQSGANQL